MLRPPHIVPTANKLKTPATDGDAHADHADPEPN